MVLWNPNRSPDKYPHLWHMALYTPGWCVLDVVDTLTQANHQRKRFNAFKACVRNYPLHKTARMVELGEFTSRIKIVEFEDVFQVTVKTRKKSTKKLQLALDSLDNFT